MAEEEVKEIVFNYIVRQSFWYGHIRKYEQSFILYYLLIGIIIGNIHQ